MREAVPQNIQDRIRLLRTSGKQYAEVKSIIQQEFGRRVSTGTIAKYSSEMEQGKLVNRLQQRESFALRDYIQKHSKYKKAQLSDRALAEGFTKESGIVVHQGHVRRIRVSTDIQSKREKHIQHNNGHPVDKSYEELKKIRKLLEKISHRFEKKPRPSLVVSKVTPQ